MVADKMVWTKGMDKMSLDKMVWTKGMDKMVASFGIVYN